VVFLAVLHLSGCAFEEGRPWGELELRVRARFAPATARLTEEGRLLTARNYAIEIGELRLTLETVSVWVSAGKETFSFDEANPPEGYSL